MNDNLAVAGASVCGLFAATQLAQLGYPVTVFERRRDVNPPPRTLIVTHRMTRYLNGCSDSVIVNEINNFELFANGRVESLALTNPDLIVERSALVRVLAKRAQDSGVEVVTGKRITDLKVDSSGLRLVGENGKGGTKFGAARVVIAADGAASSVARSAGWPAQPTLPLIQALVPLPPDVSLDTVRVWFRPDLTPYFLWLLPHSADTAAVGLISDDKGSARAALRTFLDEKGLRPREFQAANIPLYRRWTPVRRSFGSGDVYLVGDAAGHVKVSTVGGIVTGIRGAKGVVEMITDRNDRELKRLKRELDLHLLIRRAIHDFSQDDYVRVLDLLNQRSRSVLATYSRDETPRLLAKICLSQPRLLLAAARGVLRGSFTSD